MKQLTFMIIALCLIVGSASAITWTASSGCYTASVSGDNLYMWNATGNTSFTIPANATNVWYTIVGAGASGGAGS